jgi:ethanolamine ammonia-lyase large subunit
MKINQAIGREAIRAELRVDELTQICPMRLVQTGAGSHAAHLNLPEAGAQLSAASRAQLLPESHTVQILISDGLSSEAVHHNLPRLLPVVLDGLRARQISFGQPILARYGRVKLAEAIAEQLHADLVIHLIGERPGGDALASRSLSAYLVYRLADPSVQAAAARASGNPTIGYEYSVISNIYETGLPPLEAASLIVERASAILAHRAAGNRLATISQGEQSL